jgi:hypothetical protein
MADQFDLNGKVAIVTGGGKGTSRIRKLGWMFRTFTRY